MKKLFYITIGLGLFIAFSCKKNTPSSQPTPAPTSIGNLSVDGAAISNLVHSYFMNGGNFAVIAYGSNSIPELQVTFSGTTTPTYGTYAITTGAVTYGKCTLTLSDTVAGTVSTSTASSGYVNVTTSGTAPNNTLSFSNITVAGGAGHHTLNATITY
ncbi:MAG TPA: hypothetical protein VK835_10675 [Bacteroidia bacterium]|jgi:hypothetical protein|nr:hypothetical protein [Bacteroidia bacterium]